MKFIDANIYIRYLTQDDPAKARASAVVLAGLTSDSEEAMTSEAVLAEVIYVLTSRSQYGLAREDAASRLRPIVELTGLRIPSRAAVLHALEIYATYPALDFEDALSVAHMQAEGVSEIVSYDRGFDRVEGVVRIEP